MTTKHKKHKVVKHHATETTVVKGTHLTVTTHPNGTTTLVWDDAALLTEVRAAIAKYQDSIELALERH